MPAFHLLHRHPTYTRLLVMLSALIVWGPFSRAVSGGGRVSALLFAAVLVTAVVEVSPDRRSARRSLLLGGPAIGAQVVGAIFTLPMWGTVVVLLSTGAFLGYVIVLLLRDILSHRTVTRETIRGAVTIYLLIGVFWITVYAMVLILQPGSIAFSDALRAQVGTDPEQYFSVLEYFSFVTLTTLGYGDISPVSPFARVAATTEAVVGQLFIAITIARLVGLQISAGRRRKAEDGD